MLHTRRTWGVKRYEDPAEMVEALSSMSWTLCTALETSAGTIWVNDSITEDSAQEYGVLRPDGDGYRQVETITVSWCDAAKLRAYIDQADRGDFDQKFLLGRVDAERIDTSHHFCWLCA